MKEVLQKLIAQSGKCSRRNAQDFIRHGKVRVNGKPAQLGDRADKNLDSITINGKKIVFTDFHYYAFYKPKGVVTTLKPQKGQRSLLDFLPKNLRLIPVGRLDRESEGLLLLTNDGEFANRIMHPRYEHKKTYEVTVDRLLEEKEMKHIRSGVMIEKKKTLPLEIFHREHTTYSMTLREGRNRIIRKIMKKFGRDVLRLKRVQIELIRLGTLQPGKMRRLYKHEKQLL
ncbi:MAG TPA: pseudouridine synthase [Patescibacteria group bacterium]|nr:pseudouridine synthase [Patescibacteria group bacterium]